MREGLEVWARDHAAELLLLDDQSDPTVAIRVHGLLSDTCEIVLGPYGSDLTRAVAKCCPAPVVWNHGAAADDVQRLPGVISVPSPASHYLIALARAVTAARPGATIFVLTAPGRFAEYARRGLELAASPLGIELTTDQAAADALLLCGPITWETDHLRRYRRPGLLLGAVSPGLADFPDIFGADSEGIFAPVQWHSDLSIRAELGPSTVGLADYVAAQAYAAALVADHCHRVAPDDPLTLGRSLRTTTFFGEFELATDGLQAGHQLAVVQWRSGRRELQPLPAGGS